MAGSITISSSMITTQSGSKAIGPLIISAPNPIGEILDVPFSAFTSNEYQVNIPPNSSALVFAPPAGNLSPLFLKGINADQGFAISTNQPTVIGLPQNPSPSTLVINATSSFVGSIELSFI